MNQIHNHGLSASRNTFYPLEAKASVHRHHRVSDMSGYRSGYLAGSANNEDMQHTQRVSLQSAENALHKLLGDPPPGASNPSLHDVMEMDPMVLSMMMTQLVLQVSGSNALSICKQLERATDVQAVLRNKQVAEYQEQIKQAIAQADQARKAGICNVVFDWIIGGVESVMGVLKMAEGVLTADPLALADGVAYFSAGMAGMVKAGAETALLLGADKDTCNHIINVAGDVQTSCECVALALDIVQIGRGISAARAVTKATESVLESGVGGEILEAVSKGAADELESLAENAGKEISRVLGQDFGMPLEREMVEVGEMAAEAEAHQLEAEANMVRSIGKSFTREGVEKLAKTAITDAGKGLLKQGEEVTGEKLRDAILQKLRRKIAATVISDCSQKAVLLTRATQGGANQFTVSAIANKTAELQKKIETLIMQQGFIDFMQNWMEDHKKTQQKRLSEAYQDSASAMRIAADIIDNSGTVLANIAGMRA